MAIKGYQFDKLETFAAKDAKLYFALAGNVFYKHIESRSAGRFDAFTKLDSTTFRIEPSSHVVAGRLIEFTTPEQFSIPIGGALFWVINLSYDNVSLGVPFSTDYEVTNNQLTLEVRENVFLTNEKYLEYKEKFTNNMNQMIIEVPFLSNHTEEILPEENQTDSVTSHQLESHSSMQSTTMSLFASSADAKLSSMNTRLSLAESPNSATTSKFNSLSITDSYLNSRMISTDTRLTSFETFNLKTSSNLVDLNALSSTQNSQVTSLSTANSLRVSQITSLSVVNSTQTSQVNSLSTLNTTNLSKFSSADVRLSALESKPSGDNTSQIVSLSTDITYTNKEIANVRRDHDTALDSITAINTDQTSQLNSFSQGLSYLIPKVNTLSNSFEDQSVAISSILSTNSNALSTQSSHSTQISSMSTAMILQSMSNSTQTSQITSLSSAFQGNISRNNYGLVSNSGVPVEFYGHVTENSRDRYVTITLQYPQVKAGSNEGSISLASMSSNMSSRLASTIFSCEIPLTNSGYIKVYNQGPGCMVEYKNTSNTAAIPLTGGGGMFQWTALSGGKF